MCKLQVIKGSTQCGDRRGWEWVGGGNISNKAKIYGWQMGDFKMWGIRLAAVLATTSVHWIQNVKNVTSCTQTVELIWYWTVAMFGVVLTDLNGKNTAFSPDANPIFTLKWKQRQFCCNITSVSTYVCRKVFSLENDRQICQHGQVGA